MNSTIIAVRVFAEVPDRESALALAKSIKMHIGHFGAVRQIDAKRYWKIPEWFEASVKLQSVADVTTVFNGILHVLGEDWQIKQISSDEKSAIWNHETGHFFDPTVRWANVECFPESAISRP